MSQQGYDVLSFDFRGIGQSLHGALKDSTASINDWGLLDIPAAIDALLNRTQAEKSLLGIVLVVSFLALIPTIVKLPKFWQLLVQQAM